MREAGVTESLQESSKNSRGLIKEAASEYWKWRQQLIQVKYYKYVTHYLISPSQRDLKARRMQSKKWKKSHSTPCWFQSQLSVRPELKEKSRKIGIKSSFDLHELNFFITENETIQSHESNQNTIRWPEMISRTRKKRWQSLFEWNVGRKSKLFPVCSPFIESS